jgi:hypothetical protein
MTVPNPSTENFDRFDLHEAYRARLATHLCRQLEVAPASAGRFDDAELTLLVDRAQFQPFRAGQRLVGEGEHLDCVMVLLLGSASFERWSVEVGEGGVLGAHEFLGVSSLSAASAVVARGDGVLAAWATPHLYSLMAHDGPLAYKLTQFLGRFAMGIGATLCHVLREDAVLANTAPQREFRAGVGGSHKRAGGVRYVVIGGGGSGGGGGGGGSSAAAEAVYIEKMQQQAERLRVQLSESERLSASLQEKTHASVRYRLQYATAAKRLEQRDIEKRQVEAELDATYTQLEQQRRACTEAHALLKELAGVATAVLDDLPNLEQEAAAAPNMAPAYGATASDEDALTTALSPRQMVLTTALPSLRAALLSTVRFMREHELTITLERPHPNSPVGSARQAAPERAGGAPKTALSLNSRRGFGSRAASLALEPGAPGAQDGAGSSSATAMLADVAGGARDDASAVASTIDSQPAAPPLHLVKSGAAGPSQIRGATGTTGAAAGAPGAAASAPAKRESSEAVCEVGVQAGGYRVPYPSVAASPLSGEETTRPLSRAAALVRRVHSSTQTSTLGVGTARSRLETFAAQTQTEESFLDGMAVTRPPRMAAGVYGSPHRSDAATAEVILEALDAARYGAPARHEFVCNGSSAVAQKQTPVPSTQPSTRPSTAASRPSRPSTAGGGRVYPSSLSAGVAASTMYAALPRSSSSPSCRPVSATPTSKSSAQSSTTSTAGPIAVAIAIAGAHHGAQGAQHDAHGAHYGAIAGAGGAGARLSSSALDDSLRSKGRLPERRGELPERRGELPERGSLSASQFQKARFHGPLPMVRLVHGFSQSGTPHRLHSIESEADLERQLQQLGLPPSTRWVPNPVPKTALGPSPCSSALTSCHASRPGSAHAPCWAPGCHASRPGSALPASGRAGSAGGSSSRAGSASHVRTELPASTEGGEY